MLVLADATADATADADVGFCDKVFIFRYALPYGL